MQTTSHFPMAPRTPSMPPKPRDPLQCPVCQRTFSRKDNLRTHQRLHTGEKPFLCKFCAQPFRWAGALHTHENLHLRGGKAFKFMRPSRSKFPSSTSHHPRLQSTQQQPFPLSADDNPDHQASSKQPAPAAATVPRVYTTLISQPADPFRSSDAPARLPPISVSAPLSPSFSPFTPSSRSTPRSYALASSSPTSPYADHTKRSASNASTLPLPVLPPIKFQDSATSSAPHLQPAPPPLPSAPSVLHPQPVRPSSTVAPSTIPPPPERNKLPPVSHAPHPSSDLGYRLPSLSQLTSPPVKRPQPLVASFPISTTNHPTTRPQIRATQPASSTVSLVEKESLKCRVCCRTTSPKDELCSPRQMHAAETSYSCKSCRAAPQWRESTRAPRPGQTSMGGESEPKMQQESICGEISADEMTVRPMEQGDGAKGLFTLLQRHTTLPQIHEQFAQIVEERKRGGRVTVVAVEKGRVVGMGALLMEKMFVHGGRIVGHVMDVVVENRAGNDKVHKGIVEKLAKMGWDGGCHKIVVESDEENVTLHESCGFAAEKRRMGMCMYRAR